MTKEEIELLFPEVFQRTFRPGSPLLALVEAMVALQQPAEHSLRNLVSVFDPRRCPDSFVPFLATWADLTPIMPVTTGVGYLRQLIAKASELAQLRGTARGLLLFLETATGVTGFELQEQVPAPPEQPKPFHIRICAPAATATHRALIERIIDSEKPAHLTYELDFR